MKAANVMTRYRRELKLKDWAFAIIMRAMLRDETQFLPVWEPALTESVWVNLRQSSSEG
jgi:hypothetical protein